MKTKIAGISAALLLAASLSAPASAAFICGGVSVGGGLDTLGTIVSDLTIFDLANPSSAVGGVGDFSGSNGAVATMDLDTLAPAGTELYITIDDFIFTVATVSSVSTTPFSCADDGTCQDQQVFDIAGTVSKAGFKDTFFSGNFTANGSCVEGAAGTCEGGLVTGNYSSSIYTTGCCRPAPVPVPATPALLGLGLAGLGIHRRKRTAKR